MKESATITIEDNGLINRLKSFSDIIIRLASEHNIDKLLYLILSELRNFTNADAGSLYIREEDHLTFKVTQNDTLEATSKTKADFQRKFKSFTLPINDKSLAGLAGFRKQTFNIPDVPKSQYHDPKMDKKFNYPLTSMLVVPMLNHSGDLVGVLQLMNAKQDDKFIPFDELVIPQVEALSNQAAVLLDNLRLYNELDKLFDSLVRYSIKAIDARDPCTAGHSGRVAQYALELAKAMNCFSQEELKELNYAALFHDIGKIGVRENVLTKENKLFIAELQTIRERFMAIKQSFITQCYKENWPEDKLKQYIEGIDNELKFIEKINVPSFMSDEDQIRLVNIYNKTFISPDGEERKYLNDFEFKNLSIKKGNLNDAERLDIESHVIHSNKILSQIPFPKNLTNIPEIASKHHEKLDGSGYPYACQSDEIPLQSRILSVVDVYDALVSQDRPYKKPMSVEKALSILDYEVQSGKFDPKVVSVFKMVLAQKDKPSDEIQK